MFRKCLPLLAILLFCLPAMAQKRILNATPTAISFGDVIPGTAATQSVTLQNTGTLMVKVSAISTDAPEFTISGVTLPKTLAAGATLSFQVAFAPVATGSKTGTIAVSSNAQNGVTVELAGSGSVPLAPLVIVTTSVSAGTVNSGYAQSLMASGGKAPYVWSVATGTLPEGLSLSASGSLMGTPAQAGTATFTVRVLDAAGNTADQAMTLMIAPAPEPLRITTTRLWGAIEGKLYNSRIATTPATLPVTFSIASGALPQGLTLNAYSGEIYGTPVTAGTSTFAIRTSDGTTSDSRTYILIVSGAGAQYGNTGSAYETEGGASDPAATILTSCNGMTALAAHRAYRLGGNVSAASGKDRCFTLSTGTRLDLGGFTVTGSIKLIGTDASGVSVFNGTILCNVVEGAGTPGCLSLSSGYAPGVPARFHHLTITNTGDGTRAIHIDWHAPAAVDHVSLRMYNLSIVVPAQPTVSRSYAISVLGQNQNLEFLNNDLTCSAEAAACQGIMCYGTGDCRMHHNRMTMVRNTTGADTSRAMLFDGGTQNGEAWNNLVAVYNNRAVRIRGSYNVRIHDNRFLQIEAGSAGAIHLADPAATDTNNLNAVVDENDFEMAGGTGVFLRNGINAFVKHNRVTCVAGCSSSRFAYARSPLTAGTTFSELTVENNPDVPASLTVPAPNRADSGASLTLCNSGMGDGLGSITYTSGCQP